MTTLNTEESRQWLISHLKMGPVKIAFTKKDGSTRTMNCTLKEDLIVREGKKTDRTKSSNNEVLSVFDLDANGWRSFRLENVYTISFEL